MTIKASPVSFPQVERKTYLESTSGFYFLQAGKAKQNAHYLRKEEAGNSRESRTTIPRLSIKAPRVRPSRGGLWRSAL